MSGRVGVEVARTRTSTSFSAGTGAGISVRRRTSGGAIGGQEESLHTSVVRSERSRCRRAQCVDFLEDGRNNLLRKQANLAFRCLLRPEHDRFEPKVSRPLRQCFDPEFHGTSQTPALIKWPNRTDHVVEPPDLGRVATSGRRASMISLACATPSGSV